MRVCGGGVSRLLALLSGIAALTAGEVAHQQGAAAAGARLVPPVQLQGETCSGARVHQSSRALEVPYIYIPTTPPGVQGVTVKVACFVVCSCKGLSLRSHKDLRQVEVFECKVACLLYTTSSAVLYHRMEFTL